MRTHWLRTSLRELPAQMGAPFNSFAQPGCVLLLVVLLLALLFPLVQAALIWLRAH